MIDQIKEELDQFSSLLVERGFRVLTILVAAFIAYRLVKLVVRRFRRSVREDPTFAQMEPDKRADTLGHVIQQIALMILVLVSGMLVMKELGFDIGPVLASAGIAGLAIGFGPSIWSGTSSMSA